MLSSHGLCTHLLCWNVLSLDICMACPLLHLGFTQFFSPQRVLPWQLCKTAPLLSLSYSVISLHSIYYQPEIICLLVSCPLERVLPELGRDLVYLAHPLSSMADNNARHRGGACRYWVDAWSIWIHCMNVTVNPEAEECSKLRPLVSKYTCSWKGIWPGPQTLLSWKRPFPCFADTLLSSSRGLTSPNTSNSLPPFFPLFLLHFSWKLYWASAFS